MIRADTGSAHGRALADSRTKTVTASIGRLLLFAALALALWATGPATAQPLRFAEALASWDQSETPPLHWPDRVQLPNDWSAVPAQFQGHRWYRLRFADPMIELPAVYLDRACTNVEIWVNGVLVGSGGQMVEPYSRNCYYPQLFVIPRGLLTPTDNYLDVRLAGYPLAQVAARQRVGGLSVIEIGPESALRGRHDQQLFWNITIAQIIGSSMSLFGVFVLALGLKRRQDRHFMYFGALQIGWALLGLRLYLQDIGIGGVASEILITSMFPPVVMLGIQFLLQYVRRPSRVVSRALALQCVLAPLALVTAAPLHLFPVASAVYTALALEFVAALLYFGVMTWRHQRTDFYQLGSVVLVAGLLSLAEIAIQNNWLPLPRIHLIHFVMPVLFFAIGLRLVQQFAVALSSTEQLNLELERRVAEKSAEIERSYAQLSELRASQAAQQERQRIASDLHDDLGAKLLSIVHAGAAGSDSGRVADLARDALDDMRLSVRGITGASTPAEDVLADWRAETVERLRAAGMQCEWDASAAPPRLVLPARVHVQLTRVLREAVSNAIRHSAGTRVTVRVDIGTTSIALAVDDNGRGLDAARTARQGSGQGLPNIERRVRKLGGSLRMGPAAAGGLAIRVEVPLAPAGAGATPADNAHSSRTPS